MRTLKKIHNSATPDTKTIFITKKQYDQLVAERKKNKLKKTEVVKNKGYNPYRRPDGKFGSGASKSASKGGSWKASGSKKEVEEFSKNSKIKEIFYHGTTESAANSIKKEGFNLNKSTSDRMFGDGFYLVDNKEAANWYAKKAGGDSKGVIETKINVKNPYVDNGSFDYKVGEYVTTKFGSDMFDWGVENKKFASASQYHNLSIKKYNKLTAEFSNSLLEKHDAVKIDDIVMIKNPKTMMVVQ